ncbi:MAG: hypothetical protein AAB573_04650 [Patescibacteria group bacterium]
MELAFARTGYVYESQGISASRAFASRRIGHLRERLLVSPIGYASVAGLIVGGFSEFMTVLWRLFDSISTYSAHAPIPFEIGTVFGASDFIHALIPALGILDGGLTVMVASLVVRYGLMYLIETKRPVVAGITGLRRGRVKRLARRMSKVTSMRKLEPGFKGGIADIQNGRAHMAVALRSKLKNSIWAHELGHIIAFHVTGGHADALSGYKNLPGARDMYTVYEKHYPKSANHIPWEEAFAEFCEQYMRHPHITKLMYPKGCRLLRRIVNNSPAGQFIQFA